MIRQTNDEYFLKRDVLYFFYDINITKEFAWSVSKLTYLILVAPFSLSVLIVYHSEVENSYWIAVE